VAAGTNLGVKGAISVDRQMRTNLPDVFAAGDCVTTHHRLLGTSYLPLGTTAHKQGRVAGENALGASREFAGSLGTQVVKIFDLVAARTGSEIAKRIDVPATAIFNELSVDAISDLDLAYTPPLGSPWDAIQAGAQAWVRHTGRLADARHRGVG
jgi:NADPH-dependent 2,4-dienoyl-CoA reductase/sulfur reductase-like enzyme